MFFANWELTYIGKIKLLCCYCEELTPSMRKPNVMSQSNTDLSFCMRQCLCLNNYSRQCGKNTPIAGRFRTNRQLSTLRKSWPMQCRKSKFQRCSAGFFHPSFFIPFTEALYFPTERIHLLLENFKPKSVEFEFVRRRDIRTKGTENNISINAVKLLDSCIHSFNLKTFIQLCREKKGGSVLLVVPKGICNKTNNLKIIYHIISLLTSSIERRDKRDYRDFRFYTFYGFGFLYYRKKSDFCGRKGALIWGNIGSFLSSLFQKKIGDSEG